MYELCTNTNFFFLKKFLTDVTDIGPSLMYWANWINGSRFVSSKDAQKSGWSHLIIQYLEERLI